jgi:adenylyltransferase/sulfurtransferase
VLPGTVGCIQATETVKHLLGKGEPLEGVLLFYDALDMTFEKVPYEANPDCAVCSESGKIESIHEVEYSGTCPIPAD